MYNVDMPAIYRFVQGRCVPPYLVDVENALVDEDFEGRTMSRIAGALEVEPWHLRCSFELDVDRDLDSFHVLALKCT